MNNVKQLMMEFEQMTLLAKARAYSKLSPERPLSHEEFEEYKETVALWEYAL